MIKSADIQYFMGFERFHAEAFTPINVFIGKNDTGKTSLLKLLYVSTWVLNLKNYKLIPQNNYNLRELLAEKLLDTFQPGTKGLGELVSKPTKQALDVRVTNGFWKEEDVKYSFGPATTNTIQSIQASFAEEKFDYSCLFIPAKEVLTAYKAIRATRDILRIPGFDDTYIDLIRVLGVPAIPSKYIDKELRDLDKGLEDLFEGRIEADDDDFIFKKGNTRFPMSLTAEGIKKIGILNTLIRNGMLTSRTVLFLDEPETALHPDAIRTLVEMLVLMAKAGVQIFLATHSYFVLKQVHISARKHAIDAACFELTKQKGRSIETRQTDLRNGFPDSDITEAAMRMADDEIRLDLGL